MLHCNKIRLTLLPRSNRCRSDARTAATQKTKALDFPHLCGALDRGGVERALSEEPEQGADRPLGCFRSADADRLRLRPSAGQGRGRQGRRAGLASRRHARAVRRHPARRDEYVDDDQRHRRLAARALCGARRRARRAARHAAGHHPERHHQGIPVARHLRFSPGAVDAAHQGRDFVHDQGNAEMESDQRVLLSPAGGRRHAGAGACLCARHRDRRARHREGVGPMRGGRIRRRGRAHLVLRQCGPAVFDRSLQNARFHRAVG